MKIFQKIPQTVILCILLIRIYSSVPISQICETLEKYNNENTVLLNGGKIDSMVYEHYEDEVNQSTNMLQFLGMGGNGAVFRFNQSKNTSDNADNKEGLIQKQGKDEKIALKYIKQEGNENLADIFASEIQILKELQGNSVPIFYKCMYKITKINNNNKIYNRNGPSYGRRPPQKKLIEIFIIQEQLDKDLYKNNLDWLLQRPLEDRLSFYKTLYQSLKEIHSKEILHNDIKPANMMKNFKGETKIIDFGLSGKFSQLTNRSTDCYDFPKTLNYRRQTTQINNPGFDLYSMAVSIGVMETSEESICANVFDKVCKNQLECFNEVRNRLFDVFETVFYTPYKENYILEECEDYGCVFLSCIKNDVKQIPSLDDVLEAFDWIPKILAKKEQERKEKKRKDNLEFMEFVDNTQKLLDRTQQERQNRNIKKESNLQKLLSLRTNGDIRKKEKFGIATHSIRKCLPVFNRGMTPDDEITQFRADIHNSSFDGMHSRPSLHKMESKKVDDDIMDESDFII